MKTLNLFFMVMILLSTTSCATGELMSSLEPGMTKEQVIETLGRFDGYKKDGDFEVLSYYHLHSLKYHY